MSQSPTESVYPSDYDDLDDANYPADPDPGALQHAKVARAVERIQRATGYRPTSQVQCVLSNTSIASGHNPELTGPGQLGSTGTRSGSSSHARMTSAATTGSGAGESFSANPVYSKYAPHFQAVVRLETLTDVRWNAGVAFGDTNMDDPYFSAYARHGYAISQFSTPRGDANWMFASNDNSGQILTDTGIPVDSQYHSHEVWFDPVAGKVYYSLDDGPPFVHDFNAANQATGFAPGYGVFTQADAPAVVERVVMTTRWTFWPRGGAV